MEPYLTVDLHAGLGNQLFMIAAGFAMKQIIPGVKLVFYDRGGDSKGRPRAWTGFLADCSLIQEIRVSDLPKGKWEQKGDYNTAFVFINYLGTLRRNARSGISTRLIGFFQNNSYLPERPLLLKVFNIEYKQQLLREKVPNIDYSTTCSLHFRLGDYKKVSHVHLLLTDEYYNKAIRSLDPSIKKILVFNEVEDKKQVEDRMASLIRGTALEIQYVTAYGLKDWEEMILMSLCSANIIANSTFSWWGAYFNCNTTPTIIYPSSWINTKDSAHWNLSQPGWKII